MGQAAVTLPVVLLLEPLHGAARALLAERATVHELEAPDASIDHLPLGTVTALITRGRGRVDGALLARLGALRVVARAGVGLDNIDLQATAAKGVTVLNVPNALTTTVAEHAIALALAMRRDLLPMAAAARTGEWSARDGYRGAAVAGARVAVLGMGAIGSRAIALFRALGADVTAWSRSPREDAAFEPKLERALNEAEIVSLHMALSHETRGLLTAGRLSLLHRGATIINTARPGIVDRRAMLDALNSGQVGAYAVDGFEPEPPVEGDELLAHPQVFVTPHVAALTEETYTDLCRSTVEGVLDVLADRVPVGGARIVHGG